MPSISVILTSYNCAPYIGQAIDSILGQTLGDFELLISDDGSTDGSRGLIEDYARRDKRIVPFIQQENLGLVRNYNFLFARAGGAFVAIQDADDWSDPRRLERQVEMLADPAFVLCATGGLFHFPGGQSRALALDRSHIIDGLAGPAIAIPASVTFRRDMLDLYPGWPEYFAGGTSMDRYFLMDLLDGRKGYHLGEPLYHARVRTGSSHRSWDGRKMATHQLFLELERQRRATGTDWLRDGRVAEMDAFVERIQLDRKLMAQSIRESAVIGVDCGDYASAVRLLAKSLSLDPMSAQGWRTALYLARKGLRPMAGNSTASDRG
ncbi:MAG: glycosyltransferase family 2 protein [Sphingomicrobium sp.]